jgi:hypothetical protein
MDLIKEAFFIEKGGEFLQNSPPQEQYGYVKHPKKVKG